MSARLATIISFVLNPIFIILCAPFLLVYRTTGELHSAVMWSFYTLIFLLAMALFLMYGVKKGIFTNLDVSRREQRPLLFLVSIILTMLYLSGLFLFHAPLVLFLIAFGIIIGLFLASIINTRIKASMHVATISALIFSVAIVYDGWYLLLLLLIPIVGWARVRINRHTVPETIVGGILGSLLSLGMYYLVQLYF